MVLQHWNDVHIAVEISRVEKNQTNETPLFTSQDFLLY